MSADDKVARPQATPTPNTRALVDQAVDRVFAADTTQDSLDLIDRMLGELDPATSGDALQDLQLVLQSMGSFFLGTIDNGEASFAQASEHFRAAEEGFSRLGQDQLRDLATGFAMNGEALIEIRSGDVSRGIEIFSTMREYLQKAGKFARRYDSLLDHVQPDMLFVEGYQALTADDFITGKALIEQASQAAQKVANTYYPPDAPAHFAFLGFACYYRSVYTVNRAMRDFFALQYDGLTAEIDLKLEAIQAKDLLSKGDQNNANIRSMMYCADGHIALLDVVAVFAATMRSVFDSTFKSEPHIYDSLRRRIRSAGDLYAQAGPQAASFSKLCDKLSDLVYNLERLVRSQSVESQMPGASVQDTVAHDSFLKFQDAMLQSVIEPLKQLRTWSAITLILITLSVLLIIAGATSAMFGHTQVGVVTSISSVLTTLISGVLLSQLRKAQTDVSESQKNIIKQFENAGKRLFPDPPAHTDRGKSRTKAHEPES